MSRHLRVVPAIEDANADEAAQALPYPTPLMLPEAPSGQDTDAVRSTLAMVPTHRLRVYLVYRDRETSLATTDRTQTPWKWRADCICGWHCLSWSWSREHDMTRSNLSPAQWVAENGQPTGGALVWALEHLAEKYAEAPLAQEG